ncbi:iron-containing alcohol dehydrogenase [Bacillus freudenreichii]|nr:iron-containing alcohol dehydrogenase [Bacillus freudenreichii]
MSTAFFPRQIEIGPTCLVQLGEVASKLGGTHLLIVIDAFLVSSPYSYDERIKDIAKQHQLEVTFFSDYRGEPTTDHLSAALNTMKGTGADCVVAIGGGSAIDLAKAVSLFALNPNIQWQEIASQTRLKKLPLIAVPTTAGTGSEATKIMVITDSQTQFKMNPGHRDLIPDAAILDPELSCSLPKQFTAYTGMDALTHAIEAYVSTNANTITDSYALLAISKIANALPKVYENGMDLEAREEMLMASCYAGIAFSNASTNLAHAAGRPLGARFNIPHGLSVSLLLPFVMEFSLKAAEERFGDIAENLGIQEVECRSKLAESAVQHVNELNEHFDIWKDGFKYIDLVDLKESIPVLVEDALSGNGITTNRKVPDSKDVNELYLSLINKLKTIKECNTASL